jgi:hypothetical protein
MVAALQEGSIDDLPLRGVAQAATGQLLGEGVVGGEGHGSEKE